MCVLLQRVHPVPVIGGWVREITASQPVGRTERRVAKRACVLWAVLEASRGVLAMEDVLVGAFKLYVATGAMETRAAIYNRPQGLGIAVPAHRGAAMAVPGGDECLPLLAPALERGGELAPLAFPVCPSLAGGGGEGAWSRRATAVPGCQAGTRSPCGGLSWWSDTCRGLFQQGRGTLLG